MHHIDVKVQRLFLIVWWFSWYRGHREALGPFHVFSCLSGKPSGRSHGPEVKNAGLGNIQAWVQILVWLAVRTSKRIIKSL